MTHGTRIRTPAHQAGYRWGREHQDDVMVEIPETYDAQQRTEYIEGITIAGADNAWRDFVSAMRNTWVRPEKATAEAIRQAAELLGVKL